jgi:hypothetical protein
MITNQIMNGYNLDSHKVINICKLELNDTFSSLILNVNSLKLSSEQVIKIVDEILSIIELTTTKGFLTNNELHRYPIISEILPLFLQTSNESELIKF